MSHPSVFQTNPLPRLDHPPPVRTTTQSHRVAPSSFSAIHRPNYSAHPYRRPPPPVSSNRAAEYQIGQQFQHQTLPQRLVPTPAARYVGQPNLPGIPMHSGYANLPVASSSSNIPDHVPRQRKGRGNLPKHVTTLLKNWLNDHIDHPYPTEEEKIMLATETNLTLNQASFSLRHSARLIIRSTIGSSINGDVTFENPVRDSILRMFF
ncbi:Homeobox protein PKNOX1 [Neolecta irregularis DAH-3]|uniref:Homeobox protein PKNOX1 n=1 Tax=Neolecta irregularis (strain DAH-3) TaxID=1198029 RepID=A0A1U7LRX1_NEOID|nr:Homeobox protein PKNOX1 [Neolecta irregularis DAH-3]|eukprot:OLL25407.1 Homeobox protein PKNOX1 [Neolecta irregularis DAH-3]